VPDDTGPALPQRAATPYTVTGTYRPRGPATTGSGPGTSYPDPETLRRVADALRKLPTREQQARAAARIRTTRTRHPETPPRQ
jgi:hypothetical protein